MPDPPIPATALPTINILEDVATAQSREPISNKARKHTNTRLNNVSIVGVAKGKLLTFAEKLVNIFPVIG